MGTALSSITVGFQSNEKGRRSRDSPPVYPENPFSPVEILYTGANVPAKMRHTLNKHLKGAAKFFRISKTAKGNVLRRHRQRITQHLLPMGRRFF